MKNNINQETANKLDAMELSSRARNIIANTDINVMAECFGGLETADEVENYIRENYPDAVDKIRGLYDDYDLDAVDIESGDGERLANVCVVGNDECYKENEFFQYVVDDQSRKVYRAFYEVPESEDIDAALQNINYSKPYRLEDVTAEFDD